MAGYRRFISYMYEYTKGKKNKNTGFAKVESRNGVCRMQINLQGIPQEEEFLNIYGFVRKEGWLLGIFLGQMPVQEGGLNARINTPSEQIGGESYSLDNLAGIWTQSSFGRRYITIFDDEDVDIEKFVTELPGGQTKEPEPEPQINAEVPEEEIAEASASVEAENDLEENENAVQITEAAENTPNEYAEPELEAAELSMEEEGAEESDMQSQQTMCMEPQAECMHPQPECAQQPQGTNQQMEEKWVGISKRYPHFQPFANEEFEECVQITPRDLKILHQNHWRLGNNSFVMHGYYNYRHLLLARKRGGGYVLGIPGLYENQEKFMADMFGFPEFKDTGRHNKSRRFGYWCREVE